MKELMKLAEIMHTIFCRRAHEEEMTLWEKSTKCCYYLEKTIEGTWELRDHTKWLEQAQGLDHITDGKALDALSLMVKIYKAANELKGMNKLLIKYVNLLLEE